jgi:hypothetical protein
MSRGMHTHFRPSSSPLPLSLSLSLIHTHTHTHTHTHSPLHVPPTIKAGQA